MRDRVVRAAGLFALLMAIYLLTYSGHPISGDEQVMFDAAHSFYRNGSLELAYFNNERPYFPAPPSAPVLSLDVEPLQSYLAGALLWIAARFPSIGFIHAAWSLNLWITALTAVVLYDFGLVLGYRDRTALLVALAFGLATFAWPYSAMFFREPLFTLLALLCADALTHWRLTFERGQFRPGWLLLLAAGALAGALLTKNVALLLVIPLLVALAPGRLRPLLMFSIVLVAFAGGMFILYQRIAPGVRYRFAWTFLSNLDLSNVAAALPAWLISPGFSLWVFSPILLLGFLGVYRLIKARKYREVFLPLGMAVTIMVGYAGFSGWYSGLGWGPRYLLPMTPFLALWLLPVFEDPRPLPLIRGLAILSVLTQLLAVYVPVETFSSVLFQQNIVPWQAGIWTLRYTPLAVDVQQLFNVFPRIAWIVNNSGAVVIPACAVIIWLSAQALRGKRFAAAGALVTVPLAVIVSLSSFWGSPQFGNDPDLWAALDRITDQLRPGDTIVLDTPVYRDFFANYYRGKTPIYMLPLVPGAQPEPRPVVDPANPETQVHAYTWTLLSRLARTSSRWWVVTPYTVYADDITRANEHFLVRHFFPVQELYTAPYVRVVEFDPVNAPPEQIAPVHSSEINFTAAESAGFDLPRGDEVHPGDILPVSLLWRQEPRGDVELFDYGVNLSLTDSTGRVVAQRAGTPEGSFGLMSRWEIGSLHRDNHGLLLPADLPPGSYDLSVSLYDWRTNRKLPIGNGAATDVLVLGQIHVTP